MELFALITLNVALGMGFYIFLSAKMNRALKESQGVQLEKKVLATYSRFIHDSNQTIELLDSKLVGLRDLTLRSERVLELLNKHQDAGAGMALQLQNLLNQSKDTIHRTEAKFGLEKSPEPFPNAKESQDFNISTSSVPRPRQTLTPTSYETLHTDSVSKINLYKENKIETLGKLEPIRDSAPNLLAGLGQKVRNLMGMDELNLDLAAKTLENRDITRENKAPMTKKVAYTVDGDVFSEEEEAFMDDETKRSREEGSFLSTLKETASMPKPKDEVTITPESLLAELPPSATKIDKVVHLLKKGYTHEEVSDALDIGTREISLIETVRLQNARRA